jgi:hypothetical protein
MLPLIEGIMQLMLVPAIGGLSARLLSKPACSCLLLLLKVGVLSNSAAAHTACATPVLMRGLSPNPILEGTCACRAGTRWRRWERVWSTPSLVRRQMLLSSRRCCVSRRHCCPSFMLTLLPPVWLIFCSLAPKHGPCRGSGGASSGQLGPQHPGRGAAGPGAGDSLRNFLLCRCAGESTLGWEYSRCVEWLALINARGLRALGLKSGQCNEHSY